jgi:Xaa-Pro aminopeptidase
LRVSTWTYFGHILSGPDAAISSYADAPTGGPGLSPAFGQGPSHRPIGRNEVVSVDTMLSFNGYLNDQTRNFALGKPHPRLLEGYRAVQEIHARVRDLVRPGAITGELYEWIWQWVEQSGWQNSSWAMSTRQIHRARPNRVDEFPIAQGQKLPLESGMTFAFEPKFIVRS